MSEEKFEENDLEVEADGDEDEAVAVNYDIASYPSDFTLSGISEMWKDKDITWRNDFAHEGKINTTATLNEVVSAYEDGKEIIHCLAETMRR
uniref:Uncharacterized protein n=1 Tax=Candidatus Kentrum sp. SD TaxID=2126332 RepID=A0A450YH17_9GAMM|nr:MAG: hypothetical protein BECKSD772F_GA0070984_10748 [Candidatus Kentron sp. SD]VFK46531.1 MAG: hypothetical protein BECKSD772E_GA0070983_10758 [Candidatus Kentron sp. SD]